MTSTAIKTADRSSSRRVLTPTGAAFGWLLAAVAGFVDAACFVGILEVFTAHVTGNIAALASIVVHDNGTGFLRVVVLAAFAVGVASAWSARSVPSATEPDAVVQRRTLRRMLAVEAAWLALLALASVRFPGQVDPASVRVILVIAFAGAAMGCQSAMSRFPTGLDHPTTVMTSNYTAWLLQALDLIRTGPRAAGSDALARFVRLTILLLCFVLGALFGALGEAKMGIQVTLAPFGVLLGLLAWSAASSAHPGTAT